VYDTHRGLHLWVKSASAKYWIYRNSRNGKRTDISLGSFPLIGVAEARKKASELSVQVSQGVDIANERRTRKSDAEPQKIVTFEELATEIIKAKQPEWRNPKHAQQWTSTLKEYAYPTIGYKPLSDITTDDILRVLTPIWSTKTETATRLRGRIERVISAGTIKGLRQGVNPAQWRGHLDCLLPQAKKIKKVVHHSALGYRELPSFIKELQGREGVAALALEFCILTASRTGEVIYAKRIEITDSVWTIPADRMKAGKEHKVPLCTRTLQLIAKAKMLDHESEYVFSNKGKSLSNMSLSAVLKRMNRGDVTVHGFRSTFRDWVAEETSHSPEVAEMSLSHTIPNRVEAAYRRGNLLEKRRALLNDWQEYCMGNGKSNIYELRVA
jgi:integrase